MYSNIVHGIYQKESYHADRQSICKRTKPGSQAAHHYGKLRSYLEKTGTPIGSLDMLIAAHALSIDCILVSHNEKEFIRVPNLKIENWVN
jgi:predicted nucleic acid-binding protein